MRKKWDAKKAYESLTDEQKQILHDLREVRLHPTLPIFSIGEPTEESAEEFKFSFDAVLTNGIADVPIEKQPDGSGLMRFTPEIAAAILRSNPIKFDSKSRVIDGQHRLIDGHFRLIAAARSQR
jgi:hypothetical protein